MEMTINGAKLTFSAISARPKESFIDENPNVFKTKKTQLYYWTCEDGGSGDPDPRPARFACDVDIIYPQTTHPLLGPPMTTFGTKEAIKSVEVLLKLSNRSFRAALRKLYPTRRPAIPYKVLLDPWAKDHDVAVYAQETYLRWRVKISRPGTYVTAFIYVQFPVNVLFTSEVISACNPRGDLAIGEGDQQRVRWKLGPWGTEMVREWQVGAREADKAAKEYKEYLDKLVEEYGTASPKKKKQ